MTNRMVRVMEDWKIVPSLNDTVSLSGVIEGIEVQTTPICYGRRDEVRTENAHYILGNKQPGGWEDQLAHQRPRNVATLRLRGVL